MVGPGNFYLPIAMLLRRPLSTASRIQENPPVKRRGSLRTPETAPKGRVCGNEGCTTQLSIYNMGEICAPCEGPMSDQSDLDVVAVMEAIFT